MSAEPGSTLSHYRLTERLGEGGMGVVWRAIDTNLEREVALKTVHDRFADDPERLARFEREAKIVAALNHPNIVTIYSVEHSGGVHFLTMELVDGPTLSELIPDRGFPLDRFFEIALSLLDAICAAHRRGVVHLDLKPGNIMVNRQGLVKVLDFGLAKLLEPEAAPVTEQLATRTLEWGGGRPGTLHYMSPEQLTGQPCDSRSDLFSLGVILHEMATGRRPFAGESPAELTSSILRDDPPMVTELNPALPRNLARIIRHALEKILTRRFQTALDLRNEIASLGAEVRTSAPATASRPVCRETSHQDLTSVAVLPLDTMSGDPHQEYLADGMTEALITDLAKIGALKVISRTSVMRYRHVKRPLLEIASELGVGAVVEGSVLRVGEVVRVSASLIDAVADRHLWAERYEGKLRDVLSLQSEIARDIARQVKVKLTRREEECLRDTRSVDPEAHEHYLRGRFFWNQRTPEAVSRALAHFNRAIQIDPEYAPAHAGLADCYILDEGAYLALPPEVACPLARSAAQQALDLDDRLAEAHASLAAVLTDREWDWSGAEREFKRAIDLNPNYVTAYHWYAVLLAKMTRTEEALSVARAAREVDPLSAVSSGFVAMMLYFSREYHRAVDESRDTLRLDPTYAWGHCAQGLSYVQMGLHDQATAALRRAVKFSGNLAGFVAYLGYAHAAAGNPAETQRLLRQLAGRPDDAAVSPLDLATLYLALGERERALERLEEAFERRVDKFGYLSVDPMFDPMRSEPRFRKLLEGMNVSPDDSTAAVRPSHSRTRK